MPFAVVTRRRGALWLVTALYGGRRVSSSWHRTRAEAVRELSYLI